ncbi:MAG: hypothetical protein ABIS47_02030 [Acidimicrobiales bacterium]
MGRVIRRCTPGAVLGRLKGRDCPVVTEAADHNQARGLRDALESSDRFHRDGRLGRIFHPGRVSYREISTTNSLHVIFDGDQVSAHVDDISPLRRRPDGSARYSWVPVLRHNVVGMLADLGRRLRGTHGQERCNLTCETVWVDHDGIAGLVEAAGSPASRDPRKAEQPG